MLASSVAAVAFLFHVGAASADTLVAVSTFDDNRPQAAGTTAVRSIRLSNLSDLPLELHIQPRAIDLLNDGQTHVSDGEDPRWAGQIDISPQSVTLEGRTSQDVSVSITIAADVPPDDYVLGVVVTTTPVGPGIHVVAEVAALIPISVEGDRLRFLELIDHELPTFVIGDRVSGTIRVGNPGTTLVSAWVEADVDNAFTGQPVANIQVRDRTRVAAGASRDFTYTWEPGVTAGWFTIPARVTYIRDNASTAELDVQDHVWLIHPYVVALAVSLLLFGLLAIAAGIRRSTARRRRRPAAEATVVSAPVVAASSLGVEAAASVERDTDVIRPQADCLPADEVVVVNAAQATAQARSEILRTQRADLASALLVRAEQEVRDLQARELPAADRMERSREIVARAQREVTEILAQGPYGR